MPTLLLIHNPGAGNGALTGEALIAMVEATGYNCQYVCTNEDNWKTFDLGPADLVLLAGGDGTVRQGCKQLLEKGYRHNPIPVGLLCMGTANNLAKTLGVHMDCERFIPMLPSAEILRFGVGNIEGLPGETFFMESFGYGVFPYLMMEMKNQQVEAESPEEEIKAALRLLRELVLAYPPKYCQLTIDGRDFSGEYIMAEIMNIRSIGPNLFISPHANPSDGVFEVVLVSAARKQQFADYLERTLEGDKESFEFIEHAGKSIRISWQGTHVHADDKLLKLEENEPVNITVEEGLFRFLVPAK